MAMLKILPSGNLIRVVGETLPLEANKLSTVIIQLQKLHLVAHYNTDNCRRFVKRCCQIQGLFTSKKIFSHVSNYAVILLIEEVLQDAVDLFEIFSNRGWFERLLYKPRDKIAFERLDRNLINTCSNEYLKLSEESIENLQQAPVRTVYRNSTRQLEQLLAELGGIEALRQDISKAEQCLADHFSISSNSGLSDLLNEEIEHYELSIDVLGPHLALRHPALQLFWKRCFGRKERVSLNEFWQGFPNSLNHDEAQGLSKLLKTGHERELLEKHLTRSLPRVLSIVELDFFFEPGLPITDTIQKLLDSTSQLTALSLSKGSSNISLSEGPIRQGLLYNFPSLMAKPLERKELLMQVVFGAQDRGTNCILLSGEPGSGKRIFANQVGRFLLSIGHWTEVYWIDISGISAHTSASYQIMHQMGILYEEPDLEFLLGFLQRKTGSVGIVLSGLESLCSSRDDECRFLDYLEKLTDSACQLQVIILSRKPFKETRAGMVTYAIEDFSEKESAEWLKLHLEKNTNAAQIECLAAKLGGRALCLDIACSLIIYGETTLDKLLQRLEDRSLVSKLQEFTSEDFKPADTNTMLCLLSCIICLETQLMVTTFALSWINGNFTAEFATAMMQSTAQTDLEVQASLRRLTNRKILRYNETNRTYCCHPLIKKACRIFISMMGKYGGTHMCQKVPLDISTREISRNFTEVVFKSVIWKIHKMMESGSFVLVPLQIFHSHESQIYQFLKMMSNSTEFLVIFQKTLWEAIPSFGSRMDSNSLEKFYASCLEMAEKGQDVNFKGQCLIRQGDLLREVGRQNDSESALRDALTLCLSEIGDESFETARCYHSLGETLVKLKRFPEAVDSFEKALTVYKICSGEKTLHFADCCLAITVAYHCSKKDNLAYERCIQALETRKEILGSDHVQVSKAMALVGSQLKFMKKNREAEQMYRDSLQLMEKCLGLEHPEVASLLVEFSTLLRTLRRFVLSEPMLQRALQIREAVFGHYHQLTASCVQNLSILYKSMCRFEDAARFAMREVELRQRILGPADLQVPASLMSLATILCEAGHYDMGYKHCLRALNIREKQLGASHPSVAESCNLLAILLRHLGRFEDAKTTAQRSLDIRSNQHTNKPHSDIASSLNGLAESEKGLKELESAEEHCREGLKIRTQLFPAHHLTIGLSHSTLASILNERGQFQEAEEAIREAISIREKHFGRESFQVMQGYDLLAEILCHRGCLEEAEEIIHISVDQKIKTLGQKHPDVARSLLILGAVLMKKSNLGAARQKLNRAADILALVFDEDHYLLEKARSIMHTN